MPGLADQVDELRVGLVAAADPSKAPAMASYMKGHFAYLGVSAPERRDAQRAFVAAGRSASADDLIAAARACWDEPEREFQYVAVDLLRRWVGRLRSSDLGSIERLIRTKPWWDTVDLLATGIVGPMVSVDDGLLPTMDAWIDDDDIWIARTAILFQLKYRDSTDADRLFRYVDLRCGDTEFFIRKALGWALREYAKTDPEAVRRFVDDRADRLSPLTRREATKHLPA